MVYNSHQIVKPKLSTELNRLISGGVQVFTHPRLHSKLYINEDDILICSLNLVAGSYTESFEAGIHTEDPEIVEQAKAYVEERILQSDQCNPVKIENLPPSLGYCIKTKKEIKFDKDYPVEYKEFKADGLNTIGKYCHSCGNSAETSVSHPFCIECDELHSIPRSD